MAIEKMKGNSCICKFIREVKEPLSKTRLGFNITSIVLGVLLSILVIGLALSSLGLNSVLLALIAVTGTALLVTGLVSMQARSHLKSLSAE